MNPEDRANASTFSKKSWKNLQGDINSINKHQLNGSSSKMQYSIPKANRFTDKINSFSPSHFYQIPDTKSKRATSLGYGNKYDLSKKNFIVPGPDAYKLKSEFTQNQKHGISMGLGRQDVKTNSPFQKYSYKNPAPSDYDPKRSSLSLSYSMGVKIEDLSNKWIRNVPGPGTYSHIQLINKQTKSPLSNVPSCPSTKIGRSQRVSLGKQPLKVPGVGEYNVNNQVISTSKFFLKRGNRFGNSQRKGLSDQKLVTPGPGSYHSFSEFLR